ncbi:TonB-dependent receptor [Candidatus Poribacteria bacterium]|nr:TonB-dependent receptor [Candidatus Poribacteria bacterium]MYA58137.1 TonB-dependent receptor [Candidatus Poribacteria bacterium]
MGLQVPPFTERFRIGNLLLLVLSIGLVFGEVSADNHETQPVVKITGTVIDNDTETPIAEVSIRVTDTQIRVKTDETGAFSLGLPSGTYKIHASAPFYNTFVITDFQVSTGAAPAPLHIKLTPQVVKLDAIKLPVRLSQSSERGLLEKRMRSSRIEDSISTEEISRLPASSAGEAIKRVTGVSIVGGRYVFVRGLGERYSNTLLNNVEIPSPEPNRRVVPMDIFPASLLASLQTVKTFSPDQPGGFAGGSVQVFTKDFPEELTMSLSMSSSFNTQATGEDGLTYPGGSLDFLGFDDGSRALPNIVRDQAADLPIRERGRFTPLGFTPAEIQEFGQSFANVWSPERRQVPVNQGYKFSLGNSNKIFGNKEFGYLGVISYGNSHSYGTQVRNAFRLGLNETLSPVTSYDVERSGKEVDWGSVLNTSLRFSPEHLLSIKTLFTHTAEDETRTWEGFNADRNTDMRSTRLRYVERQLFSGQVAGMHDFNFGEPALQATDEDPKPPDVSMEWRLTYSRASRDEPDTRENIYEDRGDGTFTFRDVTHSGSRFFFDLEDDEYNARVDWKIPLGAEGLFKFGGLLRDRSRTFDVRRFRFLPADQVDAIVNLSEPPETLFQIQNIAPRVFELRESTRATDNYLADQNIYASYLMLDLPITTKWQVMTGVRLESSDQTVTTYDPFAASRKEIEANLETLDWLPGLNVTYRLTERMNLRLAASRTITRPDFRELAPFEFTDFVGGRTILGNPDLERTQINNFDFRWETFPQIGGILAVSAFYKRFQKPIEQIVQPQAEVRITYENAEGANNYGLELEARQNLGVLTEALRKFSINTNAALISSQVVLPEDVGIQTSSERPLQGQCPYIVNVSVGFEDPNWGISSAIAYNIFGRRLSEVGNHGVPDVYEQPRGQLDVSFSRTVANYFKFSISAKNLLDPYVHYKIGDATYLEYKLGRAFSFGISYNL